MSPPTWLYWPAAVPFVPTDIASLKAWWDCGDSATIFDATSGGSTPSNSGTVARIEDKSGSGFHLTQATSGARPTYHTSVLNSKSVLRFVRANETNLNRSTVALAKDVAGFTIAAVFYRDSTANGSNYVLNVSVGTSNAARVEVFFNSSNSPDLFGGGGRRLDADSYQTRTTSSVITNQTWALGVVRYDFASANVQHYINAAAGVNTSHQTSGNTSNTDANSVSIGTNLASPSTLSMDGDIAEVLCFDSALSTADREKLEGYLAWKWGLEGNLPNGHPYKNAAP